MPLTKNDWSHVIANVNCLVHHSKKNESLHVGRDDGEGADQY